MTAETTTGAAPGRSHEHGVLLALLLVANLGLLAMGLFLEPDERGFGTHEKLGLQPCFPLKMWDIPCPGCGVTTSVTHAAHGDLVTSFLTQPLGLLLALTTVALLVYGLWLHVTGGDLWARLHALPWREVWMSVGGVAALAWIYKLASVRGWL